VRSLQRKLVIDLKDGNYLLVNPYSGLADVIDTETRELLDDIDALPGEVVSFLKRRGHIVEEGEEEDLIYNMKGICSKTHKERLTLYTHIMVVTYDCNLRCPYCFERHLYKKGSEWMKKTMDEKMVDAVFRTILDTASEESSKHISLYGGEPLQVKTEPIIRYILKKGNKHGYSFSALSNGADLYQLVPLLSQYEMKEIQITIDGPRKIHDQRRFRKGKIGTFDDIVKGIDSALDHDITIGLRVNVDSNNIKDISEFAQFYKEKGWDSKVLLAAVNVISSECADYTAIISETEFTMQFLEMLATDERMDVFLETFTYPNALLDCVFGGNPFKPWFWHCNAHVSTLVYDPLGDIYPCYEAVGNKEHKIGEYIPELTFTNTCDEWRNRTVFTIPECKECNLAFFCGGGCAYAALKSAGTIHAPYCERIKASAEHVVPFLYDLIKTKNIDFSQIKRWPR
jgi:uncharacterized protein